ncbi:SIR2 family protein [Chthonobacter rhizosphaerae]|uniref:SIR2 family protein n=1 Tax=Chthonobacter rhizosphaerae TaxID=2735553 RepID=UPI0015EE45A9|nr:SIR2 family protein [Chthonobacter rhizosphaerae]
MATAQRADLTTLAAAIRDRRCILFAGAGVSMAVGLPSWADLIEYMAAEAGVDPTLARLGGGTGYHTLAEYYRIRQGAIGPLRSWMDRHWSVSTEAVAGSEIHRLIVSLGFPLIYTTNFDRNLEVAHQIHGRPFAKVTNAKDISRALDTVTQIVKFHGDFDDDLSLVLAESDYFERLAFEGPLDMKLKADALGRTLLFVGYSMSDINIRMLLYQLWRVWRTSGHDADRPPSFVFLPEDNPVQRTVLGHWGITVLSGEGDDPGEALRRFLEDLAAAVAEAAGD